MKRIYDEAGWRWGPTLVAAEQKLEREMWTIMPQQVVEKGAVRTRESDAEKEKAAQWEFVPQGRVEKGALEEFSKPIEEFETLVSRRFRLGRLQAAMEAAMIRDLAEEGARG